MEKDSVAFGARWGRAVRVCVKLEAVAAAPLRGRRVGDRHTGVARAVRARHDGASPCCSASEDKFFPEVKRSQKRNLMEVSVSNMLLAIRQLQEELQRKVNSVTVEGLGRRLEWSRCDE